MSTLHPAGLFMGEVTESALKKNKNGVPMICLRFKTEHGVSTFFGDLGTEPNDYCVPVEQTVERLRRLGYRGNDFNDFQTGEGVLGLTAKVRIDHYTDNQGATKDKVKNIFTPEYEGGGGTIESDPEAAAATKKLNTYLKAAAPAVPAKAKVTPAPKPKTAAAAAPASEGNDEDIPF
jgi:hypothetical protein